MNSNSVDIYEFSTGIKFDRLNHGGWISRGFTGEYMNCTIDSVPVVVERSISNREFRIAEGTASLDPAVVARVVGEDKDSWSVVAIISRGEDEVGRGGSFYRYFLAQGADKIPHILKWLEEDKKDRDSTQLRIFNPLDLASTNQPYTITSEPPNPNIAPDHRTYLDSDIPVIFDRQIPNLSYIHALTTKKFELERENGNHVPIAWAFNVEAVEQVKRFTLIRAASDSAFALLTKAKASAGKALPLELFDEQAVKSAIKGIANSGSTALKTKYVETFVEAIGNQAITPSHWHRLFDSQGADNPLGQKIYTPQMIKSLTLRALAIPATFPEYRKWRTDAGKTSNVEGIAQEFENKLGVIKNQLPQRQLEQIDRNIEESFEVILANFLNDRNAVSTEVVTSLLKEREGLWGSQSKQFITNLHRDLHNMQYFINPLQYQDRQGSQNAIERGGVRELYPQQQLPTSIGNNRDFNLKGKLWQSIREDIYPFWNHSYYQANGKYLKFAELFERINPKTSLIFYHISQGEVPARIFKKLPKSLYKYPDNSVRVYGVTIHPHRTNVDKLLIWLFESKGFGDTVNRLIIMIIVPTVALLGVGLGYYRNGLSKENDSDATARLCLKANSDASSKIGSTGKDNLAKNITAIYKLSKQELGLKVSRGTASTTQSVIGISNTNVMTIVKNIGVTDSNSVYPLIKTLTEEISKQITSDSEVTQLSIKDIINKTKDVDVEKINDAIQVILEKKLLEKLPSNKNSASDEIIKKYLTKKLKP